MRFSFVACFFGLAVVASAIEPTAASACGKCEAKTDISQQITTVVDRLDTFEKAAGSWNGRWTGSYSLMNKADKVGVSLGKVVKSLEESEGLSEEESTSVVEVLSKLAPGMKNVVETFHKHEEQFAGHKFYKFVKKRIDEASENMKKYVDSFFEMIGQKVVEGDREEVQKFQEEFDAAWVAGSELSVSSE